MNQSALVVTMALVLAGAACDSSNQPATAVAAIPSSSENVARSGPSTEDTSFLATGPILVENQVDVVALRAGLITGIMFDVGRAVEKGNVLATLDDRQLEAERDAAKSKVLSSEANLKDWEAETEVAESDLRRAQAMRDAGINTAEELEHMRYKVTGSHFEIEKAKQDLSAARHNLRALELEMEKTRITAPFAGIVARRYVRTGQSVAVGDRLFWVTAVAPLFVEFTLPERFIAGVKKGQMVTVTSAEASPALPHAAKLIAVSPVVDPSSGSIEVRAQIEGPAPDLRPGMLASIRVAVAR
jgi:membrane fusion protein (multidrug efflux system)